MVVHALDMTGLGREGSGWRFSRQARFASLPAGRLARHRQRARRQRRAARRPATRRSRSSPPTVSRCRHWDGCGGVIRAHPTQALSCGPANERRAQDIVRVVPDAVAENGRTSGGSARGRKSTKPHGAMLHRSQLRPFEALHPVAAQDLGNLRVQPGDDGQDGDGRSVDEESQRPDHDRRLCRAVRKNGLGAPI